MAAAPPPADEFDVPLSNGIDSIAVRPVAESGLVDLVVRTFHTVETSFPTTFVRIKRDGHALPQRDIHWLRLEAIPEDPGSLAIVVRVRDPGDGLTYTFSLVDPRKDGGEPNTIRRFDPFYASIDFRFRGAVAAEPGCGAQGACRPAPAPDVPPAEIDYLAKDFASFRRLMLERLSKTVPEWADRHVPDLGYTVVEVLAYAADHLSYYQDAVATEAYLNTARKRVSVRRHARLVGYPMHDGCNARAWVCVEVGKPVVNVHPEEVYFFTQPEQGRPGESPPTLDAAALLSPAEARRVVFAPVCANPSGRQALEAEGRDFPWPKPHLAPLEFRPEHNEIRFYTEGRGEACLPRGATAARLYGVAPHPLLLPNLRCGDVLVFEEVRGPRTGDPADADRTRRHAVRLTRVARGQRFVEVEWFEQDALPFPLCLRTEAFANVSVARGNAVLVDHGLWRCEEVRPLAGRSGAANLGGPPTGTATRSDGRDGAWRHAPLLRAPLTHAAPFPDPDVTARVQAGSLEQVLECLLARTADPNLIEWLRFLLWLARSGRSLHHPWLSLALREVLRRAKGKENGELRRALQSWFGLGPAPRPGEEWDPIHPLAHGPARAALNPPPRAAVPALQLRSAITPKRWFGRRDLLAHPGAARHVAAEVDDEGRTHLRFDVDAPGKAPPADEPLLALYRVGNGTAGNVGADRITGWAGTITRLDGIVRVRNPLPATGGRDPEPVEAVKLQAPTAFRDELQRAITAEDYARLAEGDDRVQKAKAELRRTWTGIEARVALDLTAQTLDRYGGRVRKVYQEMEVYLSRFRRIGHDVRVVPARRVPVRIVLRVTLKPEARRVVVETALRGALGPGRRPDGRPGLLHPDQLSFGDPVVESALVREAQAVEGVESVRVGLMRMSDFPTVLEASLGAALGVVSRLPIDLRPLVAKPADGVLKMEPLEIAWLEDDERRPETRGLHIHFEGGR
jgi:hypothetical protein